MMMMIKILQRRATHNTKMDDSAEHSLPDSYSSETMVNSSFLCVIINYCVLLFASESDSAYYGISCYALVCARNLIFLIFLWLVLFCF